MLFKARNNLNWETTYSSSINDRGKHTVAEWRLEALRKKNISNTNSWMNSIRIPGRRPHWRISERDVKRRWEDRDAEGCWKIKIGPKRGRIQEEKERECQNGGDDLHRNGWNGFTGSREKKKKKAKPTRDPCADPDDTGQGRMECISIH